MFFQCSKDCQSVSRTNRDDYILWKHFQFFYNCILDPEYLFYYFVYRHPAYPLLSFLRQKTLGKSDASFFHKIASFLWGWRFGWLLFLHTLFRLGGFFQDILSFQTPENFLFATCFKLQIKFFENYYLNLSCRKEKVKTGKYMGVTKWCYAARFCQGMH